MNRIILILSLLLLFAFAACADSALAVAAEKIDSRRKATELFAELLAIPREPPDVKVAVQDRQAASNVIIEDITWESLDGEQPYALVMKPLGASGKLPAVICLHGSSDSRDSISTENFGPGEWLRYGASKPHQTLLGWARELARRGYVTLALTQRGLDRRLPGTESQTKALLVYGRTLMGAIVYEIRQAITYLRTRADVDAERIGITGMSFGGITTFYTWLVDDRIAAAAPICGGVGSVDVFVKIGSRDYHGIYWWIPGMLKVGDQGDFAAAMAPRPLMLWAPRQDVGMPKEGVDRFAQTVAPAYRKAGRADYLVLHQPDGQHSFTLEAFEAMNSFFDRFLKAR
ncbi:MAG TPA: alpha/beta hydrolase family protein [Acidobacteriota bacterium]|nr:alpha/beta hydrolase family protein [Acidobacteriota bacterium]HRV08500.1 alpha/beta hydrolase family protein [Acidobacteriota bacterium]